MLLKNIYTLYSYAKSTVQRIKNGLYNDLDKDVGMWSNRSVIL